MYLLISLRKYNVKVAPIYQSCLKTSGFKQLPLKNSKMRSILPRLAKGCPKSLKNLFGQLP
jgi:hypothetical protein